VGWSIDVSSRDVEESCRAAEPPLIGRIEGDSFIVDFRTLSPGEDDEAAAALIGRILVAEDQRSEAST
jgi:hypothetical protein